MSQDFIKKHYKIMVIILGLLCLLSTPIATLLANYNVTTDEIYICLVTNYAQSIRFFSIMGLFYILFSKGGENK